MKTLEQIAIEYVKPFRHTLHLGEEDALINDLVMFGKHLKVIEKDLLEECLDTFTCQDQRDRDLKLKIEKYLES